MARTFAASPPEPLSPVCNAGIDGAISRLSNISDLTGTLEAYTYMGLGTVVERNHPESNADLSYLTVGSTGDAGDEVTGLDRFGRVVDQKWADGNTTLSEYKYGYDRGGNALYKQDAVNGNFSQLFSYDDLNQLAGYQEGTLNADGTALAGNATANQSWGYDALGNWQTVTTNGTTQARTANAQNEYTAVGNATPAYNAAGDMITDETGKQFAYDAWNRLVAVKSAGNVTLETNGYDGTNRRDTTTAGGTTTDLLYSAAWQVLEEQVSGNYTQRYEWSPIYVDALIARDADASGTGLTAAGGNFTRLWPMQDANYDVVALADATGAVVERYDYTPFGVVTLYSPDYGTVRTASGYDWQYEFQGLRLDGVTGLYYARNRDLSPTLGRPIQSDPLQFVAGDTDLYRWEANGPESKLDPTGLQFGPPTYAAILAAETKSFYKLPENDWQSYPGSMVMRVLGFRQEVSPYWWDKTYTPEFKQFKRGCGGLNGLRLGMLDGSKSQFNLPNLRGFTNPESALAAQKNNEPEAYHQDVIFAVQYSKAMKDLPINYLPGRTDEFDVTKIATGIDGAAYNFATAIQDTAGNIKYYEWVASGESANSDLATAHTTALPKSYVTNLYFVATIKNHQYAPPILP